jgi:DNA-directed RNA polymerase subunit RPC12/RpoP
LVAARSGIPKFSKSKILRDNGCPTCGSMNFGIIEIKRKSETSVERKYQCYHCKKFWHDENIITSD